MTPICFALYLRMGLVRLMRHGHCSQVAGSVVTKKSMVAVHCDKYCDRMDYRVLWEPKGNDLTGEVCEWLGKTYSGKYSLT